MLTVLGGQRGPLLGMGTGTASSLRVTLSLSRQRKAELRGPNEGLSGFPDWHVSFGGGMGNAALSGITNYTSRTMAAGLSMRTQKSLEDILRVH